MAQRRSWTISREEVHHQDGQKDGVQYRERVNKKKIGENSVHTLIGEKIGAQYRRKRKDEKNNTKDVLKSHRKLCFIYLKLHIIHVSLSVDIYGLIKVIQLRLIMSPATQSHRLSKKTTSI